MKAEEEEREVVCGAEEEMQKHAMDGSPIGPAPLPDGWIVQYDPNTNLNFYANTATGKVQWEPPVSQKPAAPTTPNHAPGMQAPDSCLWNLGKNLSSSFRYLS